MTQKRYQKGKLYELSLSDLKVDATQPRKYFDERALLELKCSIEKHGRISKLCAPSWLPR